MERVKEFEPSISTLAKLCKTTNWLKSNNLNTYNLDDLNNNILRKIPNEWEKFDAILCNPINVSPAQKIKMIF